MTLPDPAPVITAILSLMGKSPNILRKNADHVNQWSLRRLRDQSKEA